MIDEGGGVREVGKGGRMREEGRSGGRSGSGSMENIMDPDPDTQHCLEQFKSFLEYLTV